MKIKPVCLIQNEESIKEIKAIDLITSARILEISSEVPWLQQQMAEKVFCLLSFNQNDREFYLSILDLNKQCIVQLQSMSNFFDVLPAFMNATPNVTSECLNNLTTSFTLRLYSDKNFKLHIALCKKNSKTFESLQFVCPEDFFSNLFTEQIDDKHLHRITKKLSKWQEKEFIFHIISFLKIPEEGLSKARKFMVMNMNKPAGMPKKARSFLRNELTISHC